MSTFFSCQSKKHEAKVVAIKSTSTLKSFISSTSPSQSVSVASTSQSVASTSSEQQTLNASSGFGSMSQMVLKSELVFLMTTLRGHVSARASEMLARQSVNIFPDSKIAQEMALGRTKYGYLLCFGLSPFLQNRIVKEVKSTPFCAMFDESLNKISQKSQMDIIVRWFRIWWISISLNRISNCCISKFRFWSSISHEVVTKYYDSAFLRRTRATDLLEAFTQSLNDIGTRQLLCVSMDGPSVNWKFMSLLSQRRNEQGLYYSNSHVFSLLQYLCFHLLGMPGILNVGSCGLHVVHQASCLGEAKTQWELREILSSAYYLFKDSPRRRSDFIEITTCTKFPLKFCPVRWVENLAVARRFLELLPHLKVYCKELDPKPLHLKSFTRIQQAVNDPLMKAKLSFFVSVNITIEPFLRKFQSTKPLAPFIYGDMFDLITSLSGRWMNDSSFLSLMLSYIILLFLSFWRYLKPSVMLNATNATQLMEIINDSKEDDYRSPPDVGITAKMELDNLLKTHVTRHVQLRLNFYSACRAYLQSMCRKIVERSPLKFPIIRQVCLRLCTYTFDIS